MARREGRAGDLAGFKDLHRSLEYMQEHSCLFWINLDR